MQKLIDKNTKVTHYILCKVTGLLFIAAWYMYIYLCIFQMEEKHSDLLLLQRANLVAKINMRGGLLTQLLARKVIDPRGMRVIKVRLYTEVYLKKT